MVHPSAKSAVWATILIALTMLLGAADSAMAHFGHGLTPVPSSSAQAQPESYSDETVEFDGSCVQRAASAPSDEPSGSGDHEPCCGTSICHAGLRDSIVALISLSGFGDKLRVPLISLLPDHGNSGLERPPRRP